MGNYAHTEGKPYPQREANLKTADYYFSIFILKYYMMVLCNRATTFHQRVDL